MVNMYVEGKFMFRYFLYFLCIAVLFSCDSNGASYTEESVVGPRTHLIHVASNGWHTAIIVPAPALVATKALPEAADFSGAAFLEFGWGDRTYYPAKEKTLNMALIAALVPTPAIMHMAAHQALPEELCRRTTAQSLRWFP